MTISELIAHLETLKTQHEDLACLRCHDEYGDYSELSEPSVLPAVVDERFHEYRFPVDKKESTVDVLVF